MIHLVTMGRESRDVETADSVRDLLDREGVKLENGTTVSVNGERVDDLDTPLSDDATVIVAPKVANG